jgi:hypothetical protein
VTRAMRTTAAAAGALLIERVALRRQKAQQVGRLLFDARQLVEAALPDARRLYRRLRRELDGPAQKLNLEGLPRPLRWLIGELLDAIASLTGDLARNVLGVDVWLPAMERELAKHAAAAWMAGQNRDEVDEAALAKLSEQVGTQLAFLRNFAVEMVADDQFQAGWQARAESYANSIKAPYWEGKTELLPLPAMPGQGTQCLDNCNCAWRIVPLDRAAGDYDCYWVLDPRADHCQTCLERAEQWNPIRIRGFELED